jgi:hypothetical protein
MDARSIRILESYSMVYKGIICVCSCFAPASQPASASCLMSRCTEESGCVPVYSNTVASITLSLARSPSTHWKE